MILNTNFSYAKIHCKSQTKISSLSNHIFTLAMVRILVLFLILILLHRKGNSQSTAETKPVLTTQFMIATDFESVYLNFIGIGVRYGNPKKSISLIVLPTLRFYDAPPPGNGDPRRPLITPGFSIGPIIQVKRFLIGFPTFYDGHDSLWRQGYGLGIKIGPQ